MMRLSNQSGSLLLDGIIAAAMISTVALISISGINQIELINTRTTVIQSSDNETQELLENIRNNLASYQVDYRYVADGTADFSNPALDDAHLPMAWDSGIVAPAAECTQCRGRYGFVIQPYEKYRGLFILTVRLIHKDWLDPKVFQLVVTAK